MTKSDKNGSKTYFGCTGAQKIDYLYATQTYHHAKQSTNCSFQYGMESWMRLDI